MRESWGCIGCRSGLVFVSVLSVGDLWTLSRLGSVSLIFPFFLFACCGGSGVLDQGADLDMVGAFMTPFHFLSFFSFLLN